MTENREIHAVLAGNPNSGKSTLFNALTGARQTIGNFPGVTVDLYEGTASCGDMTIHLVDLPGIYSLSTYSDEERVAAEYLNTHRPDVILNVVDASNLERNLYLTLMLRDKGIPMIVILNMIDIARQRGSEIDTDALARELGTEVITTIGNRGIGLDGLLERVVRLAEEPPEEKAADTTTQQGGVQPVAIPDSGHEPLPVSPQDQAEGCCHCGDCCGHCANTMVRGLERDVARYQQIGVIEKLCVTNRYSARTSHSDRFDKLLLHRYLGIPIFLLAMFVVFQATFLLGEYPMTWIESFFSWLTGTIQSIYPNDSFLKSLILDGVIGGVGGVLVFLPNILILFFFLCVLEDSGYMARAAVLSDRWMHKIGLHGRSIVPLLVGFGCTVPAMMSARMITDRRERLTTLFVLPLFSCSARFPIYMLVIPAFFPQVYRGPILWLIYLIGILMAVVISKGVSMVFKKEEEEPFMIELVPYHRPTLRTVGIRTLERGWQYVKKAGTIILGISIILWFLTYFPGLTPEQKEQFEAQRAEVRASTPSDQESELAQKLAEIDSAEEQARLSRSCAAALGHAMEPVLKPMGFDWKIGTALVGAIAAKEVFVAQMGIVYSVGDAEGEGREALTSTLRGTYTPLIGFCIMLFCLIASPCMATFVMMARESGSWKWALAQWGTLTFLAWVVTTLVYQLGK